MAHWDDDRDRARVELMRKCGRGDLTHLIEKYEETGDDTYWTAFVEAIRRVTIRPTTQ